MSTGELARLLQKLGCPPRKCAAMAFQLHRRARMDSLRKGISYGSALEYLVGLMKQGWAAQAPARGEVNQEKTRPNRQVQTSGST